MKSGFENLKVKIFADGADIAGIKEMNNKPWIKGLTTNPTLMRKSGITDYKNFAQKVLEFVQEKPISFEVFSDDLEEMKRQAHEIASWGQNVFVKIPITNTKQIETKKIVKELTEDGVKINVTAILTAKQVSNLIEFINPHVESYISVFAGRIADTGRDPLPIITESLKIISDNQKCQLIWASPRELLNIFQANQIGCHIITATDEILNKLKLVGKDLDEYSLETVKMFREDALKAGYEL
jgi:transaldolase